MVHTVIVSHNAYHHSEWENDPSLHALAEFFRRKQIPFQNLQWENKKTDALDAKSEDIDIVLNSTDFSCLKEPFIVVNGHGHFHHRTYFFVYTVKQDITYMHFDAHADFEKNTDHVISYANFVSKLRSLPQVRRVQLLGLSPGTLAPFLGHVYRDGDECENFEPIGHPDMINESTDIYLGESIDDFVQKHRPQGDYEKYVLQEVRKFEPSFQLLEDFDPGTIPTEKVYVSIDMDVIPDFPTGWIRQGVLSQQSLLKCLEKIGLQRQIVGADITGFVLEKANGNINPSLELLYAVYDTLQRAML